MSENPDLELAIARVLQNAPEPLVKEGLTALDGIFQTEAGNVLVRGDVLGGRGGKNHRCTSRRGIGRRRDQ